MPKKYTIEDIARIAGVSRGTVSRVLNNHPSVSDENREKVCEVIEALNYRPNFTARQMRTNSSELVGFGLVSDEVIITPHAVDMIRGAQETLWTIGKVMLVINSGYGTDITATAFEAMLERRVDGIIFASSFHRPVELPFETSDVPIVLANCYSKDRKYPSVVPDEFGGGYTATKALVDKGHQRIAFINLGIDPLASLPPVDASTGRLGGYKQALAEGNIPFDGNLVRYTDFSTHTNFRITRDLMASTDPPTAIFCGTDRTAMGCYMALLSSGLRIPDDVAVIGFDNQLDIGIGLIPNLTTIQLPHYEMGRWAVEYLIHQADKDDQAPIQHKLPCPLVERESV